MKTINNFENERKFHLNIFYNKNYTLTNQRFS